MKTLYLLAGCNGAGKTTAAYALLPNLLDCREFVNADEIARGLSPFRPETVSVQAGRLMLTRLQELLAAGETFALETTLATRIYLPFIEQARAQGYAVHLLFFWLSSADQAVARVKIRVREGGHNIPEPVIRRRYETGLRYFFSRYRTAVDTWLFVDNTTTPGKVVAEGTPDEILVSNAEIWPRLTTIYHDEAGRY
ncbi:AAA family ATPase [Hymenobacter elongatus]|uniref:Zeta toxin n=1 Tax=Hymenobacter elongatus TaxID=877208 RepID=A0A4Z0PQC9_9BACT|nr:AAA family ATPase [Hymenobacter elongatus]TGE19301.1 zeta toxin [Hymenobacter elongatus]